MATVDAWPKLGGALLSFLTMALNQMEAVAEEFISATCSGVGANAAGKRGSAGAEPLVAGLASLKDLVLVLFPFPRLARRCLAFLLGGLESADDAAVLSLAFVRIAAGGNARGRGGAGSLPLLRECFAELFGEEKPSAYQHAYPYIHDLARKALAAAAEVHKRGGKTREAGPALRRWRSWEFLQSLQLWAIVVAAHPAKSSLGPLVPPLAKVFEITFQLKMARLGLLLDEAGGRAADGGGAAGKCRARVWALQVSLEKAAAEAAARRARGSKHSGEDDPVDTFRGTAEQNAAASRPAADESTRTSQASQLVVDMVDREPSTPVGTEERSKILPASPLQRESPPPPTASSEFKNYKDRKGYAYPRGMAYVVDPKGWHSQRVFDDVWVPQVWNRRPRRQGRLGGYRQPDTLLAWDDYTVHTTDASNKAMDDSNTTLFHIPGGVTPKLQPCDGLVNKIFKANMSRLYDDHMASKDVTRKDRGYPEPPSRGLVAQWVKKAWDALTADEIRSSWRGLVLPVDGSKDEAWANKELDTNAKGEPIGVPSYAADKASSSGGKNLREVLGIDDVDTGVVVVDVSGDEGEEEL
eukprot:g11469.t1